MSVHRAGSFYGVPHSTLEYKVKERNLLRHKNKQKLLAAAAAQQSSTSEIRENPSTTGEDTQECTPLEGCESAGSPSVKPQYNETGVDTVEAGSRSTEEAMDA